jgi:hypothetical protein
MIHTPTVLSSRVRYIASRSYAVRLNLTVTDVVSMHYSFNTEDFHFGDLYKEEADPSGRAV